MSDGQRADDGSPSGENRRDVLVVGGGGREHALAWALAKSPRCGRLFCAPGNAGTAALATNVDLDVGDHDAVVAFARDHEIGLVVIGPEAPLVAGLGDALRAAGIAVFGPSAAAARLEASKGFTKDLCARVGIPTAPYARFSDAAAALAYAAEQPLPVVVKADGLAAGKGVVIAETQEDAAAAITACFSGAFGAAGAEVVVEGFLDGEEASFFALVDGRTVLPLATAQDHKRAGDGDVGPNTGGMGAYSPAPIMDETMVARTLSEIIQPTVDALADAGTPYSGVLFAGLMVTANGPELIEYNVRFGDPECQVLILRLESDLLEALEATAAGHLAEVVLRWSPEPALTVVMATRGYPGAYERGSEIRGLAAAAAVPGVTVFHAGTKQNGPTVHAAGGRVLNVTAKAPTVAEARARAYEAVAAIDWPEGIYRSDIAWRALARSGNDRSGDT